jgi:hypothetical protein
MSDTRDHGHWWEYAVGYAVWRQWRWNHYYNKMHKHQTAPTAKEPGYPTWIAMGFIVTLLFLFPLYCFWGVPFLVAFWFFCDAATWLIVAGGCMSRYKEKKYARQTPR